MRTQNNFRLTVTPTGKMNNKSINRSTCHFSALDVSDSQNESGHHTEKGQAPDPSNILAQSQEPKSEIDSYRKGLQNSH